MRKENGFVPIDEANTENINFAVDLPPYLDRALLRVNPERISRLMNLAGISKLDVETYEKDRYQEYPAVVGFGADGSAYSGKAATRTEQESLDINVSRKSLRKQPTADVNIKIDIKQIADEVASQDLRSERLWAKKIDKAVNSGMRESGNRVLLLENTLYDFDKLLIQGVFLTGDVIAGQALLIAIDIVVLPQLSRVLKRSILGIKERNSFFAGPQLDRAAILHARTRLQEVVKGFEREKGQE